MLLLQFHENLSNFFNHCTKFGALVHSVTILFLSYQTTRSPVTHEDCVYFFIPFGIFKAQLARQQLRVWLNLSDKPFVCIHKNQDIIPVDDKDTSQPLLSPSDPIELPS